MAMSTPKDWVRRRFPKSHGLSREPGIGKRASAADILRRIRLALGLSRLPHRLSICAIFKNEAYYLNDWLTFHAGLGVDHFYLYNNESDDDYLAVLEPWIAGGKVTLTEWPGKGVQAKANTDCLWRARYTSRWIAFIDIDEYLFSPSGRPLPAVLGDYADCAVVFVYWWIYGSSGNVERSNRPIAESCTWRFDFASGAIHQPTTTGRPALGKSIVNPRRALSMAIHLPDGVRGKICDERKRPSPRGTASPERHSTEILRINHYWSRSIRDLHDKAARGRASDGLARDLDPMLAWDAQLNYVEDRTIIPIWQRIVQDARAPRNPPVRAARDERGNADL
jgi:hypothetical protein